MTNHEVVCNALNAVKEFEFGWQLANFQNFVNEKNELALLVKTVASIASGPVPVKIVNVAILLNQRRQKSNNTMSSAYFNSTFISLLVDINKHSDRKLEYLQFFDHIFEKDTWYIPINPSGEDVPSKNCRWILCVVCIKTKTIRFINPLLTSTKLDVYYACLMTLIELHMEVQLGSRTFNKSEWNLVDESPHDYNLTSFDDTGVYMLFCIDFLSMLAPIDPLPFTMETYRTILLCSMFRGFLHSDSSAETRSLKEVEKKTKKRSRKGDK